MTWLTLVWVTLYLTLFDASDVKEAGNAIGWLSAGGKPMLRTLCIDSHALCAVLRQLRVVAADTLNELAVAWCAGVSNDDLIIRALFRTAT